MKKSKLAVMIGALMCGAAIGTTSALAAVEQSAVRAVSLNSPAALVARHGADDPQPPACDDHGSDLCNAGTSTLAKHGADDPQPPACDDHGTNLCNAGTSTLAKHGADDPQPPACDDHGTDLCKAKA